MDDLPSVRLLRGEQPEPLMLRSVNRATGQELWSLLKAASVRDPIGSIEAAVTIIEDVTAAKRAALRTEYLAQSTSCSPPRWTTSRRCETLPGSPCRRSPTGARWTCSTRRAARARGDRARRSRRRSRWPTSCAGVCPDELDPAQGLGRVRRTAQAAARTRGHRRLAGRDRDRPRAAAPAARRRDALGADRSADHPRRARSGRSRWSTPSRGAASTTSDVRFAEQIAERAARGRRERAPVHRAHRGRAHASAQPAAGGAAEIPGWEIAALYRPAGHGNEVGGDFYDFWEIDGDWLVMLGDVTGKGVAAAAVTSLVRHTARTASEFDRRPGRSSSTWTPR